MTDSIIPFKLILSTQLWLFLPFVSMIVPAWAKYLILPLIRLNPKFNLLTENMLLLWPPVPNTHNFWDQIMIIMTLTISSWGTTLYVKGQKRGYWCRFHGGKICYKQLRFYCSTFSINKRTYNFHRPVIMGSQLRTCLVEHHCFIPQNLVDLCVWIPSLHSFTS